HLGEGILRLRSVLLDDPQGDAVVASGVRVEPVDRPVEATPEVGPGERLDSRRVIRTEILQEITRLPVEVSLAEPSWARSCSHCASSLKDVVVRPVSFILARSRRLDDPVG